VGARAARARIFRPMKLSDTFEPRFIPLLSDYGFKVTFGNEGNTLFLRRALQALIESEVPITQVEFLPNEINRLSKDGRGGIYDLACQDAAGNFFIVEMQLSEYPEFIQRMKFYSLYRFNTLVKRGKYTFGDLPKIYCIGILATNIFPHIAAYHNLATLRNPAGELIDDQTTFVTVELAKFTKPLAAITSDLDKLLYTMKTLHTATDPIQYPAFWNEEWLQVAINELDRLNLSPEELLVYEMTLSANALAVRNEERKIQEAEMRVKEEAIIKGLRAGLALELIAELNGVSVELVQKTQQLNAESDSN
jgi:predicted transposase/invertase (TIGR01784 family)